LRLPSPTSCSIVRDAVSSPPTRPAAWSPCARASAPAARTRSWCGGPSSGADMADFGFAALRRFPDVEADNLFASDASDRLILDEAATAIADAPGSVVVIGDRYGALALGAAA